MVDLLSSLLVEAIKDRALHEVGLELVAALGVLSIWVLTHFTEVSSEARHTLARVAVPVIFAKPVALESI